MSSRITLRGKELLPLWRRRIPKPPVYWQGDPQHRLFLPQFWMRLVKPEHDVPKSEVHFETHPQMSQYDIKNYLEKIYKVPVQHLSTEVLPGEGIKSDYNRNEVATREPDRQIAYVTLAEGLEFEFPDIFGEKGLSTEKDLKDLKKTKAERQAKAQAGWERAAVPPWFR